MTVWSHHVTISSCVYIIFYPLRSVRAGSFRCLKSCTNKSTTKLPHKYVERALRRLPSLIASYTRARAPHAPRDATQHRRPRMGKLCSSAAFHFGCARLCLCVCVSVQTLIVCTEHYISSICCCWQNPSLFVCLVVWS